MSHCQILTDTAIGYLAPNNIHKLTSLNCLTFISILVASDVSRAATNQETY
jgi:hypothetical protein